MEITYKHLRDKFEEKGLLQEFYWIVLAPAPFLFNKTIGTLDEQKKAYANAVRKVYHKEWESWNTWIDYQTHKFHK